MLAKKNKFAKKDFSLLKDKDIKKEINPIGIAYFFSKGVQKATIVVPKKVFKKSSERNLLKRIFYRTIKTQSLALFVKNKLNKQEFLAELQKILNK